MLAALRSFDSATAKGRQNLLLRVEIILAEGCVQNLAGGRNPYLSAHSSDEGRPGHALGQAWKDYGFEEPRGLSEKVNKELILAHKPCSTQAVGALTFQEEI